MLTCLDASNGSNWIPGVGSPSNERAGARRGAVGVVFFCSMHGGLSIMHKTGPFTNSGVYKFVKLVAVYILNTSN